MEIVAKTLGGFIFTQNRWLSNTLDGSDKVFTQDALKKNINLCKASLHRAQAIQRHVSDK